jgi:uncharacterized protein
MIALVTALCLGGALAAWGAVPALTGRVVDEAGVLSPEETRGLEQFLADFEVRTSNQIAVLTVTSLGGTAIEDYAIEVARTWALGDRERDNGVLLLVAVQDRRIRIEVGLGLQGALTDALSSRIIRNEMAPRLAPGRERWGDAIGAGVRAIAQATAGEYRGGGGTVRREGVVNYGAWLGAGVLVLGIIGRLFRVWVSALLGLVAGFFVLGWPAGPIVGLIVGLLAPLFLLMRGGTVIGGGGSGGGISFGGFSGGGGSFDGGGASGRF